MIYIITIISLLALGAVAAMLYLYHNKGAEKVEAPVIPDAECCGQHEVCEKDSLLAAVSRDIEYYEDEELDAYRGRPSDEYTNEEVEQFQEVLYTMKSDEVAGWVRSLQLRGINLPDDLKDEVFMIVGERREG